MNKLKKFLYCLINPQFFFSYIHFVSPLFEAKDLFKKIKNIKKIDTMLCIKILLPGEEILLASDKIPMINIKKPNIFNKIKLLKKKTE